MNIQIIRAFVKLRELMITLKELSSTLKKLKTKVNQPDKNILLIFEAIKRLIEPQKEPIGFKPHK